MNRQILDMLERRMGDYRSRDNRYRRDYEDGRRRMRSRRDYRDYEDEGPYEDHRNRRDYEDGREYEEEIRLNKSDIKHWKHKLENADGTKGEHFDMTQIISSAEHHGIKFKNFDEKEFCMTVNMIYSDYCHVLKKYVQPDKELAVCIEMAKAFLDDADGPEPSEKLALYYHCVVCHEEV